MWQSVFSLQTQFNLPHWLTGFIINEDKVLLSLSYPLCLAENLVHHYPPTFTPGSKFCELGPMNVWAGQKSEDAKKNLISEAGTLKSSSSPALFKGNFADLQPAVYHHSDTSSRAPHSFNGKRPPDDTKHVSFPFNIVHSSPWAKNKVCLGHVLNYQCCEL